MPGQARSSGWWILEPGAPPPARRNRPGESDEYAGCDPRFLRRRAGESQEPLERLARLARAVAARSDQTQRRRADRGAGPVSGSAGAQDIGASSTFLAAPRWRKHSQEFTARRGRKSSQHPAWRGLSAGHGGFRAAIRFNAGRDAGVAGQRPAPPSALEPESSRAEKKSTFSSASPTLGEGARHRRSPRCPAPRVTLTFGRTPEFRGMGLVVGSRGKR